jgi:colanic acid biosynthesis glycosyl transferase WcaI
LRFLFVNQHYPPDLAPTGTLLAELAGALALRGHSIHVLTGRPTYEEARDASVPRREMRNGVRVARLPILPRTRGPLGRLLHYVSFAVSFFAAGACAPRPDAILAFSSTPLVGGLVALALARVRRVPLVYVVHDVYPDVAIALGVLRAGPIARLVAWIEALTWRHASRLVLIGEGMIPVARERAVRPERIVVVENWADIARIRPSGGAPFRREVGIDDDVFVVQYAGNFGRSQDLDTLLEAARIVEERNQGPRVQFLFVGGGARAGELRARANGSQNLRFVPFQPNERVSDVLAAADLALVPLRRGLTRYSVPSKIYSILASGRAVGAAIDAGSDVARIVDEAGCGFRVDPGDAPALAEEILRLAEDPARARHLGSSARAWVERNGTLERAVRAYESILTEAAACP